MDNQELTAEQYKARVMQQRFAEAVSRYEDDIATLLTQIAQLQTQLKQSATKTDNMTPSATGEE